VTVGLRTEKLEERDAPAIFTVTWAGDPAGIAQPAGTLTLQQAIAAANANPGPDQINYGKDPTSGNPIPGSFVFSKATANQNNGPLPAITETITIDGTPFGQTSGGVFIHLNSTAAADAVNGFLVQDGATTKGTNSIIRNLQITDDSGTKFFNAIPTEFGIKITAAAGGFNLQNVSINNIDGDAVDIINSPNNIIGGAGAIQAALLGTFTAPNNGIGVHITGAAATGNLVQQATIDGGARDGILIDGGSGNNIIGGFTSSPVNSGNIIIRNDGNGVHLVGSSNNRIQRNNIGNDGSATAKPNAVNGILIEQGSANNIIGGNDLTAGNIISGNTENGLYIKDPTSSGNAIQSNLIGISPSSTTTAMPNSGNGILVENAANTQVGSTTTAANYISGNNLNGVLITGASSAGTVVVNNRIGVTGASLVTTALDTKLGNVQDGIQLNGVSNVTVGGSGTNAPNIVGANRYGINIVGSTNVTVKGNQLGVNKLASGVYPALGNLQDGVLVDNSTNVLIGGTQSLEGNKIDGNRNGIHVINGSSGITMQGNFIGPNFSGTVIPITKGLVENFQPAFQAEDGILVEGSSNIFVGTPAQNAGNLISHNRHGVSITKGSTNVVIQNNLIGTQAANAPTKFDLGNQDDGIFIDASSNVLIGGTGPFNANTIAANLDGIQVSGGSSKVTIQQNLLRNNSQSGVRIEGSTQVTVGGNTATAKNTIMNRRLAGIDATFTIDGVFIVAGLVNGVNTSSSGNVVQGNYIGTDSTSVTTNGLTGNGVLIDGSFNNTIGMTSTGANNAADLTNAANEGNIIANNAFNGIAVVESTMGPGSADGNKLSGNLIFSNGRLGIDLNTTAGAVNLNDLGDADAGANNTQNFPVLQFAESGTSFGTHIQGTLNSRPNHNYRIEFFGIDVPNPNGSIPNYGQAKTYLGSTNVLTNGSGDSGLFDFFSPNIVVPASQFVTAVAISLDNDPINGVTIGDTSEFGLDEVVVGAPGPATYVVNNDNGFWKTVPTPNPSFLFAGEGPTTIAKAIQMANNHPGPDRIVFSMSPIHTITANGATKWFADVRTVWSAGDVPDIVDTVIIDGNPDATPLTPDDHDTQTNYSVVFQGGASHGFVVSDLATAQTKFANPNFNPSQTVLRHIGIAGAIGAGLELKLNTLQGTGAGQHKTVYDQFNLQDATVGGFSSDGIIIRNTPNNIIGGNGALQSVSIQNVQGSGVNIIGALSTNNLVQQTNIGTTFGAGGNGIWIQGGANNNTIGGFVAGTNVNIQASGLNGILIADSSGTRIQRSTVGDPTDKFANHLDGIRLHNALNTLVGGVTAAAGNTIAGNTGEGIHIEGFPALTNSGINIQSNTIGTPTAPNSGNGIFVDNVQGVLIGSTVTAANSINSNNTNGILIQGSGSTGARITNTSVGAGGGNVIDGIVIDGVTDVVIGGTGANAGGTVAGNRRGISLLDGASKINIQQMTVSGNSEEGVRIDGSTSILIGGATSAAAGNKITGNRTGVLATNATDTVTLQGNTITGQSEDGVLIDNTGHVAVGTAAQFGGNLIGGNRNGVHVVNGSSNFTIQNNIIGTNGGGVGTPNTDDGILLDGVTGAIVGGTLPNSSNFVSGNRNGLHLSDGTTGTIVYQNVFANSTETGIVLEGSSNNIIGGDKHFGLSQAKGNVISNNQLFGILLKPDFSNPANPIFSNSNVIQGNNIGTDQTGKVAFGNGVAGIYVDSGSDNLIGGPNHNVSTNIDEGNIVANTTGAISGGSGVVIVQDSALNVATQGVRNTIEGNSIFNNAQLGIELGSNNGTVVDNDSAGHIGPNHFTNFPVINTAEVGLVSSVASGTYDYLPNHRYRLDFFGDNAADPSGFGEGRTFLGSVNVDTDATGHADWNFFGNQTFAAGGTITATATDLGLVAGGVIVGTDENTGDTSEFSKAVTVTLAQGKIDGIKFEDLNGNGILDPGEPGLAGWTIELFVADANGIFPTKASAKTVTGAGGAYSFNNLTDGTYFLDEVQQSGWVQTVGPNPNPMQITGGAALDNNNFGNFHTVRVSGHKFNDLNGNGVQDSGEGPLAGVTINLIDAKTNKIDASTVTDLSGNYAFNGLFIGKFGATDTGFYRVREVVPAGYTQTTANPPDFQIVSGVNVGPLDFGNHKTGGGGGGVINPVGYIIAGSGPGSPGTVHVFNVKTLAQVFSLVPYGSTFTGGVHVAKGDVNGDNQQDIIVAPGAGTSPLVKVYDGTNGKLMKQFMAFDPAFKAGVWVAAGDVNGDGAADIIVGAGGVAPEVKVFDGKTGVQLIDFMAINKATPTSPWYSGGIRVAAGDVNGDGFSDIITAPGKGTADVVKVWDGSNVGTLGTTSVIRQFAAFSGWTGGLFVATGNVNGDAFADVIVGPDSGRRADVLIFDGATGKMSSTFIAVNDPTRPSQVFTDPSWNAGVHVAGVDLNNDGLDEVLTGPGMLRAPHMRGYNPRTGLKILDMQPFPSTFLGGVFVA
jgi:hypothetical protein